MILFSHIQKMGLVCGCMYYAIYHSCCYCSIFFFLGLGSVFTAILVLNSSRIKDIGEKFQNMLVNLHW